MDVFFIPLPQNDSYYKQTFNITILSLLTIISFYSLVKGLTSSSKSSRTSLIPKLPSVPLIGPFYPLLWQNFSKLFTSWLSKYGSTFRTSIMGTEVVLLSNPKWIQKLLSSSDPGHLPKYPTFYKILFPSVLGEGLIAQPNISTSKHHRLILSKAFSLESLKADLKVFNRHAKQLIEKMTEIRFEDNASGLKEANNNTLHAKLRESTFHTTGELFGGLENLSKEEELAIDKKFSQCQDIMSFRLQRPWCLSETIWNFFPQRNKMEFLVNAITTTFKSLANIARKNVNTKKSVKTLMDLMIEGDLNNDEIVSELANFAIGAYDTQSIGLNYFLYIMAVHPKYQKECQKEIDRVFESPNKISDDANEGLSYDDLAQLKYLEMCIKESLRMFTPVPAFARELKSPLKLEENLVLDKGTVVIVSPALIHRDPHVYPDPSIYNPDRFLAENCKTRSVYSYLPYSKGPRDCIGQKLSMIHIKLLVAYILRAYELYPGNPDDNLSKVWDTDIWPTKDLGVRWRKRT